MPLMAFIDLDMGEERISELEEFVNKNIPNLIAKRKFKNIKMPGALCSATN